jgi:hypothetical protein
MSQRERGCNDIGVWIRTSTPFGPCADTDRSLPSPPILRFRLHITSNISGCDGIKVP